MNDNTLPIDPSFTNSTYWNGPNIPCLGICTGQSVSVVVANLAGKVCELLAPYDLSTLTLDCALDIFGSTEPIERTIKSVLQLLLNNDCGLKELIDNLQLQITNLQGLDVFTVDLKCLSVLDSFGNPIQTNRDGVIQLLITEICNIKSNYNFVNSKLTQLQNQIDNLELTPIITEGNISTCIDPVEKPVSVQVKKVANEFCTLRTALGGISDIAQARSVVSPDLLNKYGTEVGWIPVPINLIQDINNINIVINDLISKVDALTECCDKGCDILSIGYAIDATDSGVILTFGSIYGTSIPAGYTDCGSTMIITDTVTGYNQTFNLVIDNEYVTPEISLGGFTKGNMLTFVINSKFCNESKTCEKASAKNWRFISTGCCSVTNLDSTSQLLTYETII